MKKILTLFLIFISLQSSAQEIGGRVLDERKELIIGATIHVLQQGSIKQTVSSDIDGIYTIKSLDTGFYDVLMLYSGYDSMMVTKVPVSNNTFTIQNFAINKKATVPRTCIKKEYKKPLRDGVRSGGSTLLSDVEIKVLPSIQISDIPSTYTTPPPRKGDNTINIRGARTGTTQTLEMDTFKCWTVAQPKCTSKNFFHRIWHHHITRKCKYGL